jgi:hypothetical protein
MRAARVSRGEVPGRGAAPTSALSRPPVPQTGALTGLRYAPPGQVARGVQVWPFLARQPGGLLSSIKSHSLGLGARARGVRARLGRGQARLHANTSITR